MKRLSSVLGLILLFVLACSKEQKTQGTVLARVDNDTLTLEELIYQIPPEYRGQLTAQGLPDVVENWVNTSMLYQKALKKGIDKDPEIQAVIKAGIREAIARKFLDEELSSKVSVTPQKIDSVYNARRDSYKVEKDRFRAKHILLQSASEAQAIYNRLAKGDDFEALARDYSIDRRSAERGGDLGYFTSDDMEPVFAETVGKMKIGSFSRPVQTSYGFHIIMLTEKQAAGADLDSLEAKRKIQDDLYTKGHSEAFQALLDSLKSSSTIERYPISDSALSKQIGIGLP